EWKRYQKLQQNVGRRQQFACRMWISTARVPRDCRGEGGAQGALGGEGGTGRAGSQVTALRWTRVCVRVRGRTSAARSRTRTPRAARDGGGEAGARVAFGT